AAGSAAASGPARKLSYMSNQAPSEIRARKRRWKRLGGRRSRRAAARARGQGGGMGCLGAGRGKREMYLPGQVLFHAPLANDLTKARPICCGRFTTTKYFAGYR